MSVDVLSAFHNILGFEMYACKSWEQQKFGNSKIVVHYLWLVIIHDLLIRHERNNLQDFNAICLMYMLLTWRPFRSLNEPLLSLSLPGRGALKAFYIFQQDEAGQPAQPGIHRHMQVQKKIWEGCLTESILLRYSSIAHHRENRPWPSFIKLCV